MSGPHDDVHGVQEVTTVICPACGYDYVSITWLSECPCCDAWVRESERGPAVVVEELRDE